MPARRTTQAVRVGTAKGKGKAARKTGGYAGRISSGSRGGLSDAALAANNRGSGGKGAPGTGGGSTGGVSSGSAPRDVVETTTRPGGTPTTPRTPLPSTRPPTTGLGGSVTSTRSLAPTETVRTVRAMPSPAKAPTVAKKAPAKKPAVKPAAKAQRAPIRRKPSTRNPTPAKKKPTAMAKAKARRAANRPKPPAPKPLTAQQRIARYG